METKTVTQKEWIDVVRDATFALGILVTRYGNQLPQDLSKVKLPEGSIQAHVAELCVEGGKAQRCAQGSKEAISPEEALMCIILCQTAIDTYGGYVAPKPEKAPVKPEE